ncbi:ABC transporter ATP-binding protein [Paraglaciecola aquimarina]|uniref:ABC transporter ATP-binding protein n=1 Tax=Paraglaciecola algarum TaxID=3050085 RepID=A0ABS9D1B2_9ALTE|nr:ABC transporter ATP-binding protein [Paraglaciecola sp. G1-23]MCF2946713.1 ABC transporter ATP-binding protein [Paraglaciecola sp. G1-23]
MLRLNNVSLAYQDKIVVNNLGFELSVGQIGCLLGPSGSGKTSALRAIAGFEPIINGEIWLREQIVSDNKTNLSTQKRRVAVVFQDYALFPHLNVQQNITFGLTSWNKQQKQARVDELLQLVGLTGIELRFPHELSGGQQQRVALVRAMAAKPDLLLLDEPFSSLDSELREGLAKDLRAILKHENATALMVTHDQKEAFSMADVVGVMHDGRLLQWSNAYALYHRPVDKFVASFIGDGVFIQAEIDKDLQINSSLGQFPIDASYGFNIDDKVEFLVRPDDIVHDDNSRTVAKVISKDFKGSHILYELQLNRINPEKLLCLALSHHDHKIGENIGIRLDLEHLIIFKAE